MVDDFMNRLSQKFINLRSNGERALIPYLTAGYPTPQHTVSIMHALRKGGADIIELGVPFSDPLADGPTIQAASSIALNHGVTLTSVIDMVRQFRADDPETPVILFGAYNPYFHYGFEKFATDAKAAGADGVLIADIPADNAAEVAPTLKKHDLHLICLIAPTSDINRKKMICQHGTGFLYYISVKGVTGARRDQTFELSETINEIRQFTDTPVAVGFGISTPAQAAQVGQYADGVIVGSALIDLITQNNSQPTQTLSQAVTDYMRSLKDALPRQETAHA